eukprot:4700197-Pleurochrysis_carterae.AAC.1
MQLMPQQQQHLRQLLIIMLFLHQQQLFCQISHRHILRLGSSTLPMIHVPDTSRLGWSAGRLRFLDDVPGVASPDTLVLRSRYLLQCLLASIIAASGGGDYGRTYSERNVW